MVQAVHDLSDEMVEIEEVMRQLQRKLLSPEALLACAQHVSGMAYQGSPVQALAPLPHNEAALAAALLSKSPAPANRRQTL